MPQSNCTAVDVNLFPVESQLFLDRQLLSCESLIYLDEVEIAECKPGFL